MMKMDCMISCQIAMVQLICIALRLTFPRNFPLSYFRWGLAGSKMMSGISASGIFVDDLEDVIFTVVEAEWLEIYRYCGARRDQT